MLREVQHAALDRLAVDHPERSDARVVGLLFDRNDRDIEMPVVEVPGAARPYKIVRPNGRVTAMVSPPHRARPR